MYRDFDDSRPPDFSLKERSVPKPPDIRTNDRQPEIHDGRSVYELREKGYRLNDLEAQMLADVGRFRAIEKGDLLKHVYKGQQEAFDHAAEL